MRINKCSNKIIPHANNQHAAAITQKKKRVKGRGRGLSLGGGAAGRRRVSTEPKNFRGEAADHGGSRGEVAGDGGTPKTSAEQLQVAAERGRRRRCLLSAARFAEDAGAGRRALVGESRGEFAGDAGEARSRREERSRGGACYALPATQRRRRPEQRRAREEDATVFFNLGNLSWF